MSEYDFWTVGDLIKKVTQLHNENSELKKQLEEGVCNHINAPYRAVLAERDELKKRENNYIKTIGEGTATIKEQRQRIGVMESENSELKKRVGELEQEISLRKTEYLLNSPLKALCKELAEALEDIISSNNSDSALEELHSMNSAKQAIEKYRKSIR